MSRRCSLIGTRDVPLFLRQQMLTAAHACLSSRSGRDVMRVCDHTPVNKLFKDFTRGSSHLAFVARKVAPPPVDATGRDNDPSEGVARTSSGSSDADTEFIGIVTLEDVRNQPSPPLISRFW